MVVDTEWLSEPLPPTDEAQLSNELMDIIQLAKNIGLYEFRYTDEAANDATLPTDTDEHIGIMAQQLLTIPGLASCVSSTVDENGKETYVVDGNKVALASLGYVAALSKIVLEMKGVEIDADTSTNNVEQLQNYSTTPGGTETEGTSTTAESAAENNGLSERPAIQTTGSSEPNDTSTTNGLNADIYGRV